MILLFSKLLSFHLKLSSSFVSRNFLSTSLIWWQIMHSWLLCFGWSHKDVIFFVSPKNIQCMGSLANLLMGSKWYCFSSKNTGIPQYPFVSFEFFKFQVRFDLKWIIYPLGNFAQYLNLGAMSSYLSLCAERQFDCSYVVLDKTAIMTSSSVETVN